MAHIRDYFGKDAYVVANPPSPYGTVGRPDIEVIPSADGFISNEGKYAWRRGQYVGIEFKSPRYGANPHQGLSHVQDAQARAILKAGGAYFVTNDPGSNGEWKLQMFVLTDEDTILVYNITVSLPPPQ